MASLSPPSMHFDVTDDVKVGLWISSVSGVLSVRIGTTETYVDLYFRSPEQVADLQLALSDAVQRRHAQAAVPA